MSAVLRITSHNCASCSRKSSEIVTLRRKIADYLKARRAVPWSREEYSAALEALRKEVEP